MKTKQQKKTSHKESVCVHHRWEPNEDQSKLTFRSRVREHLTSDSFIALTYLLPHSISNAHMVRQAVVRAHVLAPRSVTEQMDELELVSLLHEASARVQQFTLTCSHAGAFLKTYSWICACMFAMFTDDSGMQNLCCTSPFYCRFKIKKIKQKKSRKIQSIQISL